MRQWLMLAVLLIIYAGWLYIEQKFLRDPLYAMSVAHIKMFRGEHLPESKRKIVEKIMSAISHLGDGEEHFERAKAPDDRQRH